MVVNTKKSTGFLGPKILLKEFLGYKNSGSVSRTLGINSGACSGFLRISEIFQKISDDTQKTSESFLVCSRIVFSFSRTKVMSLRKKQFLNIKVNVINLY